MNAKPKSNSIITTVYDEATDTITYTVQDVGSIVLDLNKVAKINIARAAVHGFGQRIPDSAAIGLTDDDGAIIPKADRLKMKFDRMKALVEFYETGTEEWSRKGGGNGEGRRSIVITALSRIQGISYDDAETLVKSRAEKMNRTVKAQLGELAKAERVKKEILAIQSEKIAATPTTVNAADELAAMGESESITNPRHAEIQAEIDRDALEGKDQ